MPPNKSAHGAKLIVSRWLAVLLGGAMLLTPTSTGLARPPFKIVRDEASDLDVVKFGVTVHAAFVPTSEDLQLLQEQLEMANDILCDATDGRAWLTRANVTVGASSDKADIIWYSFGARSFARGGRIYLMDRTPSAALLAHEFGHAVLGVSDEYKDNRDTTNWCGWGPSIDDLDEVNNTIMQRYGVRCVDQFDNTLSDYDPRRFDAQRCFSTDDCGNGLLDLDGDGVAEGRGFGTLNPLGSEGRSGTMNCTNGRDDDGDGLLDADDPDCRTAIDLDGDGTVELFQCRSIRFATELSTETNADPLMGSWAHGGAPAMCPAPEPSGLISLDASLLVNFNPLSTCYNGRVDPGEQCQRSAPAIACSAIPGRSLAGGMSACINCRRDTSACTLASAATSCGDGVVDPGEECDPAATLTQTCTDRGYRGAGGTLTCSSNCVLNESACAHGSDDRFDLTSIETLEETSLQPRNKLLLVDALGHPNELHELIVAAQLYVRNHWALLFAMDAKHFGGTPGDVVAIGRFDLEFDPVTDELIAVNGEAVDSEGRSQASGARPSIVIGSGSASEIAPAFGVLTFDAEGQVAPTGEFIKQDGEVPPPIALEIDLANVDAQSWMTETGSGGTSAFWGATVTSGILDVISGGGGTRRKLREHHGQCADDAHCNVAWNEREQSFEATSQTVRVLKGKTLDRAAATEPMRASRFAFADNYPGIAEFIGDPDPMMPPGACGTVKFTADSFEQPGQLMMVLDRSGSMGAAKTDGKTRLWHVQQAAKAHTRAASDFKLWDQSLSEDGPCDDTIDNDRDGLTDDEDEDCLRGVKVGFVTFNELACEPATSCHPLVEIGPQHESEPGDCTNGLDDDNDGDIDAADSDCTRLPPDAFDAALDSVEAGGNTAIGTAMLHAAKQYEASSGIKSMIILSDGENNRPKDWEGTEHDPLLIAERLNEQGVLVITVPVGAAADRILAAEMAEVSGGEMYDAQDDDEVPSIFMQAYARELGQSLAVSRSSLEQDSGCLNQGNCAPKFKVFDVPVEPGVQRMTFLLSSRKDNPDTWNPPFELRDPQGRRVTPELTVGKGWKMVRFSTPQPGMWQFVAPPTTDFSNPKSHFVAHLDNPLANCHADVSRRVIQGGESVEVSAQAIYGAPLEAKDVSFTARVRKLDGTTDTIALEPDPLRHGVAVGTFAGSSFLYRGAYEIVVDCKVRASAEFALGESSAARDGEEEDRIAFDDGIPSGPTNVPAFTRSDRSSVYVKSPLWPPLTHLSRLDRDGDGILDVDEPPISVDTDGDGLPDVLDDDADGDDIPDSIDADPRVPGVSLPPECRYDTIPPKFVQASRAAQVCAAPAGVTMTVDVTDTSCPGNSYLSVQGALVAKNGRTLPSPVAVSRNASHVLDAGTWLVRWTATDINGNTSAYNQSLVVSAAPDSAAVCCLAGQTVVRGNGWPNFLSRLDNRGYCMFGLGAFDVLASSHGPDLLSGGDGNDQLNSDGQDDVLVGGPGDDRMGLSFGKGGKLFGGPGHDAMELAGDGVIYGNAGNDWISGLSGSGSQTIVPGPGFDFVQAGEGDDSVHIYDVCEAQALEVLDGGPGFDTLYTPVSVAELNARGVTVLNFEKFVITTSQRHLSECL